MWRRWNENLRIVIVRFNESNVEVFQKSVFVKFLVLFWINFVIFFILIFQETIWTVISANVRKWMIMKARLCNCSHFSLCWSVRLKWGFLLNATFFNETRNLAWINQVLLFLFDHIQVHSERSFQERWFYFVQILKFSGYFDFAHSYVSVYGANGLKEIFTASNLIKKISRNSWFYSLFLHNVDELGNELFFWPNFTWLDGIQK